MLQEAEDLRSPVDGTVDEVDMNSKDREYAHSLLSEYDLKVRPYIDIIDNLRSLGLENELKLPTVVVIGDQSSGKSSTLEAISGVKLPRGCGIMTRCPLELRMSQYRGDGDIWKCKISYTDKNGEAQEIEIKDQDSVGDEIEDAQRKMTFQAKGISSNLITLKVCSANVPDLTLIDLPGITRVAVEGQPLDIAQQIRKLIVSHIQHDETIMLAVVPCNVEMATIEAIQMAQEYDPDGERTLGVLTKPDLIDEGTENIIIKAINNELIYLKKGFTIVKCRGQKAIEEKQPLQEALEEEDNFFKKHKYFSSLNSDSWGIKTLTEKLTEELMEHVKKLLPSLREQVKSKLERNIFLLGNLGYEPPVDAASKISCGMTMMSNFLNLFQSMSIGENSSELSSLLRKHNDKNGFPNLNLIPNIQKNFSELDGKIRKLMPEINSSSKAKVLHYMEENRGRELPNFLMFRVFENLMLQIIENTEAPIKICVRKVSAQVDSCLQVLSGLLFSRYSKFAQYMKKRIKILVTEATEKCQENIDILLEKEKLIYSQDAHYLQEFERLSEQQNEGSKTIKFGVNIPSEDIKVKNMLMCMKTYYKIAAQRISDYVPMTINLFLLKRLHKDLSKLLPLIAQDDIWKIISEDDKKGREREKLKLKQKKLMDAEIELTQFMF